MAKKDKVTLSAIGKPKPKPKKTSARDLGEAANKQFKEGYAERNLKQVVDPKTGKKYTLKEAAQVVKNKGKGKNTLSKRATKESPSQAMTRNGFAKITGV